MKMGSDRVGKIVAWEDARGFGWLDDGGDRVFAHINEFPTGERRPRKGEWVRFVAGKDAKGRVCATKVVYVKRKSGRLVAGGLMILCLLLALPVAAWFSSPLPWWVAGGWMGVFSLVSFGQYAVDKRRAKSGGDRVSEASLHLMELLGGWPGAYLAQRWLRHKSRKKSYQVVFRVIVALYQVMAVGVVWENRLGRLIGGFLPGEW